MYENILFIIGVILIIIIWSIKLIHLAIKVVITVLAVALILNFFGYLAVLNQPLNQMIVGDPAVSCAYDSDCTLKPTTCNKCDCGDVVNKQWERYCVLRDYSINVVQCICQQPGRDFTIKCLNNNCVKANTSTTT